MSNEPTYEEVSNFLSSNSFCADDLPEWQHVLDKSNYSYELQFGLLDSSLSRVKYCVELLVQISPETHKKLYKFTLHKKEFKSYTRIYQLEIRWFKKRDFVKNNPHFMPHEHIGRSPEGRYMGDESWLNWDFHKALNHFLTKTNITLYNLPEDPEVFKLKAL